MGVKKRRYKNKEGQAVEAKNWSCEFYIDGQRYEKTLDESGKLPKRDAEKLCILMKEEYKQQLLSHDKPKFEDGLLAYYQEYARGFQERKRKTHKRIEDRYCYIIPKLIEYFGGKALDGISRQEIAQYITKRRSEGVKDVTILADIACLSAMYNYAESQGLCEYRDIPNFNSIKKTLRKGRARQRYLTEVEYDNLITKCSPRTKRIVIFAVETGMRREEYLSLLWRDVDMINGRILIKDTKNGKDRNISISSLAMQQLQTQLQEKNCDYVFSRENGTRLGNFKKGFKMACSRAAIKDLNIHDLRRTFGSWRLQGIRGKKLSLKEVSMHLGHSSTQVTENSYAFLDELKIIL